MKYGSDYYGNNLPGNNPSPAAPAPTSAEPTVNQAADSPATPAQPGVLSRIAGVFKDRRAAAGGVTSAAN